MSDLQEQTPAESEADPDPTSKEISRSLGSVWEDFAGQRPRSIEVEIGRDRVECVIDERVGTGQDGAERADEDESTPDADSELSPHSTAYRHRASAAVARITHRHVVGFIPKRDEENEVSTQVFVLRRDRQRF
jgi:hypothetical protein